MEKVKNPLSGLRIEYHILQSFPVSCLNRDDNGSPKTAVIGGATRARVSSQSWKRQVRLKMKELGSKNALRTKHLYSMIMDMAEKEGFNEHYFNNLDASNVKEEDKSYNKFTNIVKRVCNAVGKDTLVFITNTEVEAFWGYIKDVKFGLDADIMKDIDKKIEKQVQNISKSVLNLATDGIDIALFGRMIAQSAEISIDSSVSFAHAISTHKVISDLDYFTALDDVENKTSHIGISEFNSATYYRYVCLNVGELFEKIGEEVLFETIENFTKALYIAVPSGKQTTMTGFNPWDYARIVIKTGQPLQCSFDTPIKSKSDGYLSPSIEAMNDFLNKKEFLAGSLLNKIDEIVLSNDGDKNIDDVASLINDSVKKIMV